MAFRVILKLKMPVIDGYLGKENISASAMGIAIIVSNCHFEHDSIIKTIEALKQ